MEFAVLWYEFPKSKLECTFELATITCVMHIPSFNFSSQALVTSSDWLCICVHWLQVTIQVSKYLNMYVFFSNLSLTRFSKICFFINFVYYNCGMLCTCWSWSMEFNIIFYCYDIKKSIIFWNYGSCLKINLWWCYGSSQKTSAMVVCAGKVLMVIITSPFMRDRSLGLTATDLLEWWTASDHD